MKVQHGLAIQWLVFGSSSDKDSHRLIVMLGFDMPYLLLFYVDIRFLEGREMLFGLPKGGEYFMAGLGEVFKGVVSVLLEVKGLTGEHNIIDFHLIGGWIATRGRFAHK